MKSRGLPSRSATAVSAAAAAAVLLFGVTGAVAQQRPKNLETMPPVPTSYTPAKTAWGDYDFRGTWPIENINSIHILLQRPKSYGDRFWLTDAEFAKRLAYAKQSDSRFSTDLRGGGTQGLAKWVETDPFAKRTSMLISPADGQLPALTPEADKLFKEGRSSWVPHLEFDWVTDFDTWDRCISRGFPASMFPFRYNNGIKIYQSPGYIVIDLEMIHDARVIPISNAPAWPKNVEGWMGDSRAHWEGKTLVIETTNIKSGDSVSHDPYKRAASPINVATQGAPPLNTIPMSKQAKVVERLTMTGPDTMTYQVTYSDPEVYTKPWTARFDWTRDNSYQFYEYACHEGDVQVRNYITSSRAHRAALAAGTAKADEPDMRERFAKPFDRDPAAP